MGEEEQSVEEQKILARMKTALRITLDEKAYDRMMNVLLVNQKLFAAASQKVIAFHQRTGKILGEKEIIMILNSLKEPVREQKFSIVRR
ncbi:MAG: hypothetical protein PHU63_00390 [Candidatus ainarchaeum sp.]|nr:hypothetical protein [Candidatus ainarchaeum sp.]